MDGKLTVVVRRGSQRSAEAVHQVACDVIAIQHGGMVQYRHAVAVTFTHQTGRLRGSTVHAQMIVFENNTQRLDADITHN